MEYPYAVTVGADGARVVFLRSSELWLLDLPTGVERRVGGGPVESYATDRDARTAAFVRDGRLFRADLIEGTVTTLPTAGPAHDARPNPSGDSIGYVTDHTGAASLHVTGPDGDRLLAGEPGNAWREHGGTTSWGMPGASAGDFGRTRGWWWAPDGSQILAVRSSRSTSLHLLDLDYGWVDVHWDRETYPYLAQVRWAGGGPLITVLRRMQQHGLVLSIDPRTGETQVHAELADARWVEPIPGTPRHLPDGRVLVGGELAHDGFDARCLFADGSLLTPPGLYVRRVAGTLPRDGGPAGAPDLIVEGSLGDPAVREVFRVRTALGGGGPEVTRVTTLTGPDRVTVGGDVLVAGNRVWQGDRVVTLRAEVPEPSHRPEPVLERVTDRRLPAAVLYPTGHVSGTRLPVLVTFGDGPGHQQVLADPAAWQERQRWADSGFAVVSIDSRGTPGVAPSFEKAVHRRLADVVLADQADALHALHGKHPDLDLSRVAALGRGLGGWLAALAVLRRPDDFHRAVAREPITDWAELPVPVAERYLGDRADSPDVYAHHSLSEAGSSSAVLLVGVELPRFPSLAAATFEEELTFLNRW
ncbi:prolyl oligopeptidase family serine peptidase [Actinoplanes sp. NEAU-A12]|uniref:Prolyl oligopeptidase family serine peptidase n=1 Tax=Actinoplanes sandaracinus TaxID=3045177 RepID=A0ABT6WIW5_9ACTN|nr:prolyl oligopeptidase family serine peptidase [Actinoplanes sandaracinus]MDI6099662.1 prolyl oligopeptidase family serine peptidase [Actinoplanes sandaracinus]